jgi:hypothetical protein
VKFIEQQLFLSIYSILPKSLSVIALYFTFQTHVEKLTELSVISYDVVHSEAYNFHWRTNLSAKGQASLKKENAIHPYGLQECSWIFNEVCDSTESRQTDWTANWYCAATYTSTECLHPSPRPTIPLSPFCAVASAVDNGPLTRSVRVGEGGTCVWCLCSERNKCYNGIVPTYCTTHGVKNIKAFCGWTSRRRKGRSIVNPPSIP